MDKNPVKTVPASSMRRTSNKKLRRLKQSLAAMAFDCQGEEFTNRTLSETLNWTIRSRVSPISFLVAFRLNAKARAIEVQWFMRVFGRYHFEGDRSDANDIIAATLSLFLRSVFALSFNFIVEEHIVPEEIDAVWLVPSQPATLGSFVGKDACDHLLDIVRKVMCYWNTFYQLVFTDGASSDSYPTYRKRHSRWAVSVLCGFRSAAMKDLSLLERSNPQWTYCRNDRSHVSVIRVPDFAALWHAPDAPKSTTLAGPSGTFVIDGHTKNFVSHRDVLLAKRLLRAVGDRASEAAIAVPMENRLAVVGASHIVTLARACGRHRWEKARDVVRPRYELESSLLFPPLRFKWRNRIDDAAFENMVHRLLALTPGIERVRSAGPTRQPDGGRDLLVDWRRPSKHQGTDGEPQPSVQTFVVQCKAFQRAVSKSDVPDLRDILEHFKATGYLLVVASHLSSGCITHLERLGERYDVDWWTRTELEQSLARHPEMIHGFPGVFRAPLSDRRM